MLKDNDRIFTNLYGHSERFLSGARLRGDWEGTSNLIKKGKEFITCLTAYSKPIAEIANKYCDIILVGDSVGMVFYGMKSTREIKLDTMILHGKAVKSSSKRSLVVIDMPYKTYSNKFIALKKTQKWRYSLSKM